MNKKIVFTPNHCPINNKPRACDVCGKNIEIRKLGPYTYKKLRNKYWTHKIGYFVILDTTLVFSTCYSRKCKTTLALQLL